MHRVAPPQEVAAHFGTLAAAPTDGSSDAALLIQEINGLLSQASFIQMEQIREMLPQLAVEQLQEIKAMFWRMTAQRLRQHVESGELEAEIRDRIQQHSQWFGKLVRAAEPTSDQQPQPEEFAWLIDECIHQRITIIVGSDQRLIELNNRKLQQRVTALAVQKREDEARRAQLQKWLGWTFGNLHRASNGTTFFYLAWTPLVIFWSVIVTMAVPTAVACPKPDGICHASRMLALSVRQQAEAVPRFLLSKLGL